MRYTKSQNAQHSIFEKWYNLQFMEKLIHRGENGGENLTEST